MFSKIRPFIFKLDPELAHDLAIKALKTNLIVKDYKKNELNLKTKLFGKEIPNPIGIAAGFDKNAEVYNPLFKLGFGFVEVGTVTPLSQYGNPKPRVFRLEEDCALINRLGFNNNGADDARSRIIKKKPMGMLGVNIGPNWNSENKIDEKYAKFLVKIDHDPTEFLTCKAPWASVHINTNGSLFPCMAIEMGNVKRQTIPAIIFGEKYQNFKESIFKNKTTEGCNRCGYLTPKL